MSRRDVLDYLGVSLIAGAGVLSKGCFMGEPNAAGGVGDGSTTYLTVRIPAQGDLSVSLADGAQCRLFVNALTYHQDAYDYLISHEVEAEQACLGTLSQYNYDTFSTTAGILDAEAGIRDSLSALSSDIAQATLSILELAP